MPTLEENKKGWSKVESWTNNGDEWSRGWGDTEYMWHCTILPRIMSFIHCKHILEIAPGRGRCTQFLEQHCEKLSIVDLTDECIEFCKNRFKDSDNIDYYVNDGKTLPFIEDESIDFIFSWDSLVHCEKDVLEAYIKEFSRILTKNGVGFIHHSNLGLYSENVTNIHWRGKTMYAKLFEEYCTKYGIKCISQEIIPWGQEELNDCFSVFTRIGSCFESDNISINNKDFAKEMSFIRNTSYMYNPVLKELNKINICNELNKEILDKLCNKKVIGWGTGEYYEKCQNEHRIDIDYFVDSEISKQGKYLKEKEIYSPEKLLSENKDEVFIMIYSKAGYYDICKWLLVNKFKWEENFYYFLIQ